MAIFRVHKNKDYTTIDNNIFRNQNLSSKAIGLLCVMLSLPDNWDFTEVGLATIRNESRESIRYCIKQLEDNGYLIRTRNRNDKGQLTDTTYDVYEQPMSGKPMLVKPMLVKPMLEKHTQLNTNILNTNKLNTKEIKEKSIEKKFVKPTTEEIQKYCDERDNGINAIAFYDFYESKNWYIGKNKMKDWKACIRTWEQRDKKNKKSSGWDSDYWNE